MKCRLPVLILLFLSATQYSFSRTVDVYPVFPMPLHRALENTKAGDIVRVHKGWYCEGTIVVDKAIQLIADGDVTVDGADSCEVIVVTSNNVTIRGFTICHTGDSYIYERSGIRLKFVEGCVIDANTILCCSYGIYSAKSKHNTISNNFIQSNANSESASGNGIHCWYCDDYLIRNNVVDQHRDGIYLEFTTNTRVMNNESKGNIRYGLHFMFSHHNEYQQNRFHHNGSGVAVMYTHDILMKDNVFEDNLGDASYALLLKEISHATICNNVFKGNSSGIYAESGGSMHIYRNNFISNGWAMRLMASSVDNLIDSNNFSSNSFDVATNDYTAYSTFHGNYWDRYTGYDLDKNGVGDVPFRPVRLFSTIVEQNSPAMLLLHSFFVSLLDLAESIFPTVTPATMQDDAPSMKPLRTFS